MKSSSFLSFFSFPKDDALHSEWVRVIQRIDPVTKRPWKPTVAVVCSAHFSTADVITNRGNTLLKSSAVPHVELPPHLVFIISCLV